MTESLHPPCPMCGQQVSKEETHCPACGERLQRSDTQHLTVAERMLVRKFRTQCQWLCSMWIFLGVICAMVGLLFSGSFLIDWEHASHEYGAQAFLMIYILLAVIGVVMMTFGFYCRRRKEIGIYLSPLVCYLALAGTLLLWNVLVLPVVLLLLVFLIQSHRVLGTTRRMKRAGIPLDHHP